MRYVDDSKQELLVSTTQFPALVIAHQSYDKARYHWHSGLEVLYAKDCPHVRRSEWRHDRAAAGTGACNSAGGRACGSHGEG